MGLLEIKRYFLQTKMASLSNLCAHFNNADPDVLRQMLCHWINKGKIRQGSKTAACGAQCMKCSPLITEIYEWVV